MADKKVEVKKVEVDSTNPFNKGVSYKDFLSNVKGNVTVDSLLKRHNLSKDAVKWVKEELNKYEQNNKK